jgi:hypothetical protein
VVAEFERTRRAFKVIVPPFQWLYAGEELTEERQKVI